MPAEIIDVHPRSNDGLSVQDMPTQILKGLSRPAGEKRMPTMLLYDERGLRLYDDITTAAAEYYLFGAEEEILKKYADDIVRTMHRGVEVDDDTREEVVLELGAGALRKTSHILLSLSRLVEESPTPTAITYYALDLERRELERTLAEIEKSAVGRQLEGKVETKGMCGTYDDGLKFVESGGLTHKDVPERLSSSFIDRFGLRDTSPVSSGSSASDSVAELDTSLPSTPAGTQPTLHIMFLGSSLGNFPRKDAAAFLRSLPLRPGSGDTLLIGLDHDNEKIRIEEAYNDRQGYTKKFIMNGLRHAGRALGDENMFDEGKWDYVNLYNAAERRHEAYYKSMCPQTVTFAESSERKEFQFLENELMKVEESIKFSEVDSFKLFTDGNLRPIQRWTDSNSQYSLWSLERPPFSFPLLSSPRSATESEKDVTASPFGVPTTEDWKNLWAAWDCITLSMIPPSMRYQKPINLRHICLFYIGHIPTFLDIHLSRLLKEPNTEPEDYKHIFERGIDPDVEDPSQCHPHSEVPKKDEDWPTLVAILQFQARVRSRLLKLYDDIDSGKISMTRKIGRVLFMTLEHEAMHAETLLYMLIQCAGSGTLPPLGFITPPWNSLAASWNTMALPKQKTVILGPAIISLGQDDDEREDSNPTAEILTHSYGWDNENPRRVVSVDKFEITWRPVTNKEFYTFFTGDRKGKVDLPASWIQDDEGIKVRTLYGPVSMDVAQDWPVVTSYDNLSAYAIVQGGRLPTEPELRLFYDKFESGYEGGANVGFRNWHPVPATTGGEKRGGRGNNGGVWEWTSTVFDNVDGFTPSPLYPGYAMDFFDGKHQVVLGGSYSTIPRISERRSFRNWYQRNYPYPWVGGRVAYDIPQ